jgi:hypothetical protein
VGDYVSAAVGASTLVAHARNYPEARYITSSHTYCVRYFGTGSIFYSALRLSFGLWVLGRDGILPVIARVVSFPHTTLTTGS